MILFGTIDRTRLPIIQVQSLYTTIESPPHKNTSELLQQLPCITRKVDQADNSIVATISHCIIKYSIMQFSFRLVTILAAFFLTSPVVAENQIRIVLNNGVAHPDMSCTTADFSSLMKLISGLTFPRRNLRQGNVETNDGEPDVDKDTTTAHQERKLPPSFYPPSCKHTCQGFATGTCLAVACKGFRRELEATEENVRDRQNSIWCTTAKRVAESTLDRLSQRILTNSCRALVQAPRAIECIYDVVC
jgi:hypothetical protein